MKVRLIAVEGDQEAFIDLIGAYGVIKPTAPSDAPEGSYTFYPNNRSDWLVLAVSKTSQNDDKFRVETKLSNTFVFRVL